MSFKLYFTKYVCFKISFFMLFLFKIASCNADVKISEKKVIICGIIKDGEQFFLSRQEEIQSITRLFKDYRIIIYENNSVDDTKNLFQQWAREDPKFIFLSEDLSSDFISKYAIKVGDYRTAFIARARNIVLDVAMQSRYDDFDYVIMMDLDGFIPINLDEFQKTFENPPHEWNAVFANGSYDIYSLRCLEIPIGSELYGFKNWCKEAINTGEKFAALLENEKWLPVDSGFGGFGIYKRTCLKGCRYDAEVTPILRDRLKEYLELSKEIIEREYFKYLKTIYINMKTIDFILNNCKKDLSRNVNSYFCEHVNLNLSIKKNGFDGLYVNPHLERKSTNHFNF